ncbi:uncharacterized protein LOC119996958 [Tripterygium wilfordii]|uniref:uncharacterized protein LOC119996958 n=1 Tax=Tripterygium wilfordii TaxID=458696 RepID=UPI0018F83F7B|nr:uncharacterized protein LOC119996958 [Tripterygium wilfordii]
MASSSDRNTIPVFNGEDYASWKNQQMTAKEIESTRIMNAKALSRLQNGAKEAWDTLAKDFEEDSRTVVIKLQNLRREFENLHMLEAEVVKTFYDRVVYVVNQMQTLGEEVTDQKVVQKILISLPESGSLEAHKQRRERRGYQNQSVESAFQAKLNFKEESKRGKQSQWKGTEKGTSSSSTVQDKNVSGSGKMCDICKRVGHIADDCWHKGKPQFHHCKRFGHIQKYCRFKTENKANLAKFSSSAEENLFYATQSTLSIKNNVWYLDCGCSNHMSGNEALFDYFNHGVSTMIRLGNGEAVSSKRKGRVKIQTIEGVKFINDVLYVPALSSNLLSVG